MQKFDTPAPVSAVLDIPSAHIRFIAADRSDTTVEVLPANPAKNADLKAVKDVTVAYADGVLRIEAGPAQNKFLGSSGTVEITVQLPAGSRVEAKAAAGDFRGVGRLGDVAYEGSQGPVKLDEAAGARLAVLDGDITIGRLGGPAEITTQRGSIQISEAVQGDVVLSTQKGDITVGAGRGTSATLDAGTSYGRVNNSLNNTDGPAAALNIRATTSYGDITARSN
ncbi:DUF4097 domain-containing protein [Streptomyces bambusae]|uniref:DUF4097 family beta strand repeat-containing protein n=1 Tax=Streptomyces bambusae TaxID=1550616 RepID=UPI001CFDE555|nr:DUF4097 family beta strand repeat-containing protein [Streptomyces bambusae]MCB5165730.1 DUF4097 domain-containing protein [Streptomyces bambusae]